MSKKITVDGHVYWHAARWSGDKEFEFIDFELSLAPTDGRVKVLDHTFTLEIPGDFDPRPAQLATLDAKEHQLKADFAKAMMELADDRAKLLAITNEVAA